VFRAIVTEAALTVQARLPVQAEQAEAHHHPLLPHQDQVEAVQDNV